MQKALWSKVGGIGLRFAIIILCREFQWESAVSVFHMVNDCLWSVNVSKLPNNNTSSKKIFFFTWPMIVYIYFN